MRREKLRIEAQRGFQNTERPRSICSVSKQAVADEEIQVGGFGFGLEELPQLGKRALKS